MIYADALALLGRVRMAGGKLGLDNILELAKRLGHPERDLRFIHIAGTNGKGSTAAFLASCLRAWLPHERIGLFTSPHLVRFTERIQVNGEEIREDAVAAGVSRILEAAESVPWPSDHPATYFEWVTALALLYFRQERTAWVVWETGLGGRLDATNIVVPEVSVITTLGHDHQAWLGDTLEAIAAEKAGIVKPGIPVVAARPEGGPAQVIANVAKVSQSPLHWVEEGLDLGASADGQRARIDGQEYRLGLVGPHQVLNASVACTALRVLAERGRLPRDNADSAIQHGLATARWPARFQVLRRDPLWVVDGAHNPSGALRLAETWRSVAGIAAKCHLVCGILKDKAPEQMLECFLPLAESASFVTLPSDRALPAEDLLGAATSRHPIPARAFHSLDDAWPLIEETGRHTPILFAGSLFLAGEVLARIEGRTHELALNDRLGKP
jgi:dihydrofolate synthase/folylpolyglutamate synthase